MVTERQLCEHLTPDQLEELETRGAWANVIFPSSIAGCPMRVDRLVTGFSVTYGKTMQELRGHRPGDDPKSTVPA